MLISGYALKLDLVVGGS